jgi:hypothetical protein
MNDKTDPKQSGLVPVGSKALTTTSSALVKRGLEALVSQPGRIVRFPADRSMGKFLICDQEASTAIIKALLVFDKESPTDARANITVPPAKRLFLKVDSEVSVNLSPLANLMPDDLYSLDLGWTQVTDAGLLHIRGLTGLQHLSLGHTQITDPGLENIRGLTVLQGLDLSNTPITDGGLLHLGGLAKLQELNLKSTKTSLSGHLKTGQRWSGQNRPTDRARDLVLSFFLLLSLTSLLPDPASPF